MRGGEERSHEGRRKGGGEDVRKREREKERRRGVGGGEGGGGEGGEVTCRGEDET